MPRQNVSGSPAARAFRLNNNGRYYFEVDCNHTGSNAFVAVCPEAGAYNAGMGISTQGTFTYDGGSVAEPSMGWGMGVAEEGEENPAGGYACFAVNMKSRKFWVRVLPGYTPPDPVPSLTDWNDDPTADPATGVGGYSFATLVAPLYVRGELQNQNSTGGLLFNFGASAYHQTPPVGFGKVRGTLAPPGLTVLTSLSAGNLQLSRINGSGTAYANSQTRLA